MKRLLSVLLSAIMVLSALTLLPVSTLPANAEEAEEDTGVETISFAKNGLDGTPYTSGLNNPFGFLFHVDESKKLLAFNVVDMATYSNNTNKGTVALYHWKNSRDETVKTEPIVKRELVNWIDHTDLVVEVPSEARATGDLYFEVIATEGSGYTPWFARGGIADPVPGKVTDMQAYVGGNPNHAFTATITIADYESQSPSKFVTWTYDFGRPVGEGGYGVTKGNQISWSDPVDGYTTFTAEGDDPYFRFPDDQSPTGKGKDAAYIAIKYRTTSDMAGCEIFCNRGGLIWGNDTTYATASYVNDGEWHVTLCDATTAWGRDADNSLFAFRFDPLASGCKKGDTVDVQYMKFFADGEQAKKYMQQENAKLEAARADERAAGTFAVDFIGGKVKDGLDAAPSDALAFYKENFVRLMAAGDASPALTVSGLALGAESAFVKIAYRASANVGRLTLTAGGASARIDVVGDCFWHEASAQLAPGGSFGSFTLTADVPAGEEWIDVTYVTFCTREAFRDAYVYPLDLSTHAYKLGETEVPVLTCTDGNAGDSYCNPFCGPGQYYGQKFVSPSPVTGIIVYNNATWDSSAPNAGYFKLFKWTGDYKTSVAGTPLVTKDLKNVYNGDLVVSFDELPAGEYVYEVKMTSGGNNAYTARASKVGVPTEGTVNFRSGSTNDAGPIVAAYVTKGQGLVDLGPEYSKYPTYDVDFTAYLEDAAAAYGLSGFSGCKASTLCDNGYVTITNENNDPFFVIGAFPELPSTLVDWVVIKYRTETTAAKGEFFVARTDGVTWGQDYARSNINWSWQADGEWHLAIIDATGVWGNVDGVNVFDLRLDPLEKPVDAGETIDIAYIKFFANGSAARDFADSEYIGEGENRYVPAPRKPHAPGEEVAALMIDGEALNVVKAGSNNAELSTYSYANGCIHLAATDDDPYYMLLSGETQVGRYAVIRYRTSSAGVMGEFYTGSVKDGPSGQGDRITFNYEADGQWHNALVDLASVADFNAQTAKVKYLRFDFLAARSGRLSGGESVDVEYIAFFDAKEDAETYRHVLPVEAATYTAKFLVNGRVIYTVTYRAGDASIKEPVVPQLPGMIGSWEPYTLDGDIEINAVYKSESEEETETLPARETDPVTEPVTDPASEPETDPVTSPESSADTEAPTEGETEETETSGCRSALSVSALALLIVTACAVIRKKKENE